ncbi:SURF1 family protein [Pannonibacter tanglangensis]|nr:SURF1 family protein [Pannonibacter sp. XCT-53]
MTQTTKRPSDPQPAASGAMRRLLLPTLLGLAALAILLNLGLWQLNRLAWKEGLIRQVEQNLTLDPVAAPGPDRWATGAAPIGDYLRVRVTGAFLPGEAYYYNALTSPKGHYGGPGYFVHAPFRTDDGWIVMVNRGFVPDRFVAPDSRPGSAVPAGPVTLTGILRLGETPNMTTPAPDLARRIWFARDPAAMASALGATGPTAPFVIDADAAFTPASGLPQAGETVVRFKNDHLGYALTWFGLAATLVGVYIAYAWSVLRRPDPKKPEA